ncbi:hypothetical protein HYH02_002014 [Chlamydomonas schloesseri]|uniref:Uncharacterized protein n=1 Tax=Chlamydomonas schloesseri TaxID=2026947 RepID=A0A835WTQ4_9CHLO|nr:hypothetical protein HYH02_002014 [Chlamydomonas schloesseri]|eukprot:KAG2453807.1 hypothetical protein HYH02_002014 [Chlamydomonas schloesseri]
MHESSLSSGWRVRGLPLPEMTHLGAPGAVQDGSSPGSPAAAIPPTAKGLVTPLLTAEHAARSSDGQALPNGPHDVASALGLMAVALLFLPLLLLLGHAEVATFGLVAGLARLTGCGAAVAGVMRWRNGGAASSDSSSSGSSPRSSGGSAGPASRGGTGAPGPLGYVVPLPHQPLLQIAAVGAVLLPLALSLGAVVWSAVSGAPCGRWLKAALLYALALLLPSPGVARRVQTLSFCAQAARAALLCGAGWLVAAEASVAATAVSGCAVVARLWMWLVAVVWTLQTLGWVEASW